jgi:hypothetical protein
MNYKFIACACAIVALTVTGVTITSETAHASVNLQDNTTTTQTAQTTPTTTETPTATPEVGSNLEYEASVDETLRVINYTIRDSGLITVRLESDYYQRIVLTELMTTSGIENLNQKEIEISRGITKVSLKVDKADVMGLTIASNNGIVGIRGKDSGFDFTGTYSGETLLMILITGMGGGIGIVTLVAYRKEIKYSSEITREL